MASRLQVASLASMSCRAIRWDSRMEVCQDTLYLGYGVAQLLGVLGKGVRSGWLRFSKGEEEGVLIDKLIYVTPLCLVFSHFSKLEQRHQRSAERT